MNLIIRVASAAVLLPLVLYVVWVGGLPLFAFAAFAALIGAHEILAMLLPDLRERRLQALVVTLMMSALAAALMGAPVARLAAPGFIALAMMLSGVALVLRPGELSTVAARWSVTTFASVYVGLPLLLMVLLRKVGAGSSGTVFGAPAGEAGAYLVFLAMGATWSNDTFAYFAGRSLGKHKMAPLVSPKKTWEGAAGGLLGAFVAILLMRHFLLPELPLVGTLLYGLAMATFTPIGDLCESLLKRSSGVKDSGNLIPGHGGVLDRIDALLFGLPITYLFAVTLLSQ